VNRFASLAMLACLGSAVLSGGGCREAPTPPEPKTLTTATGIEMVYIPAGQFVMGSNRGGEDERPARQVRVSAFYMDRFEVTQKAYKALMGTEIAKFKGPDRPVERISWSGAVRYCNMRSLREGLEPCYDAGTFACNFAANGYRLPTEAQWEYACRAGTATAYGFGNDPRRLTHHAWFKANAGRQTQPVGAKRPNPWGLHDMHGNVAEWCNDFYSEDGYPPGQPTDPRGPATGSERVLRGGSWRSDSDRCRSAARDSEQPGLTDACFGYEAYGFRCVRRAD